MRQSRVVLLFVILISLFPLQPATAQSGATSLQQGIPIERTLTRGQTHSFSISLEQDQVLELVVDQRGIDVVVRVFSPGGKGLGEFDSPNGSEGPENLSVTASTRGVYRIEVAPLEQFENTPPGRYEIRIVELRHATEQELAASKNQEALKAKGFALLNEVAENLQQIHLPQTRVRDQLQAAQLFWNSDEKRAGKLVADAVQGVKEYLTNIDLGAQDYYQNYQTAMQLRREVLQVLAPHDPELALSFLRSTRTLTNPESGQNNGQQNQELQLELSLASQIAAKDPKRAFQIAEDTLKKGYSSSLIETLTRLRSTEPELAAKLAKDIAAKLEGEKLLKNPEAVNLAVNLLRQAHSPVYSPGRRNQTTAPTGAAVNTDLLSDQEYRDLFQKTLSDGLSYSRPATNFYSPERNSAQNILTSLKSMTPELEGYAPGSVAAVEKTSIELNTSPDPQDALRQKYQNTIDSASLDAALEAVSQAPQEMRGQLYQQIAGKAAAAGDFARARQILQDQISNPFQRRQALMNVDQQAIYTAVTRGNTEEALRILSNFPSSRERGRMLSQIVNQIGPGRKRATALNFLEQARSMLGAAVHAEDQEQMNALFEIARAFSRYDSKRAFEVVEPLVEQFNEMSTAAMVLNGFEQRYYQDGELMMQNGNSVANSASQLSIALGTLAPANFERAKAAANMIHPAEVRLGAYLAIAQQAIQGTK